MPSIADCETSCDAVPAGFSRTACPGALVRACVGRSLPGLRAPRYCAALLPRQLPYSEQRPNHPTRAGASSEAAAGPLRWRGLHRRTGSAGIARGLCPVSAQAQAFCRTGEWGNPNKEKGKRFWWVHRIAAARSRSRAPNRPPISKQQVFSHPWCMDEKCINRIWNICSRYTVVFGQRDLIICSKQLSISQE